MSRAVVLLQPGAADWEFGHLLACLREYLGFTVTSATPDGADILTIGGLRLEPDTGFDTVDLAGSDLVVLIGSSTWEDYRDAPLFARLKARVEAGRPTAAICAGTLALARAGVLDDRPHTSNSLEFITTHGGADYDGLACYRDVPHAISDGVVITASGAAPVSFAVACMKAIGAEAQMIDGFWELARGEFSGLVGGLDAIEV